MSSKNQKNDKTKEEQSKDKGPRREKSLREAHIETLDILQEISTLLVRFIEFHIYICTKLHCRILVLLAHN